jgi:YD repeat-containing protein
MKNSQLFSATEWRKKVAHGETVGFNSKMDKAPDGAKEMVRGLIFCRPCRGLVRLVLLPTVSPWATFLRASGALAAMILFFAVGARAETTNDLSDAEIQGRQLAQKLCDAQPTENFTNTGVLQIRDANGKHIEIPIQFEISVTESNWQADYETKITSTNGDFVFGRIYFRWLTIVHSVSQPNFYRIPNVNPPPSDTNQFFVLTGNELMTPFDVGSDFWICDLGLEFFHWPEQKILKKEIKRSRGCSVLESTNPDPSTNGYSRVVSWIDNDGGGIVQAFAYDAQGKLLKEFYPTSLKKVDGQYQVSEMEMLNDQTGSRTRLEFDLKN